MAPQEHLCDGQTPLTLAIRRIKQLLIWCSMKFAARNAAEAGTTDPDVELVRLAVGSPMPTCCEARMRSSSNGRLLTNRDDAGVQPDSTH